MFSSAPSRASHTGQCEGGRAIDIARGTRWTTTLRKDPMTSPAIPLATVARTRVASDSIVKGL